MSETAATCLALLEKGLGQIMRNARPKPFGLSAADRAKLFASGKMAIVEQTNVQPPRGKVGRKNGNAPNPEILKARDEVLAQDGKPGYGVIVAVADRMGLNVQSVRNAVLRERMRRKKSSADRRLIYCITPAQLTEKHLGEKTA